jgi:hypothetical protein
MRNVLSSLYLRCKIHEVTQKIRPMARVLDLEGIALGITRGFYSLILLLYCAFDAYAVVAFSSSPIFLSSPDAPTHGFFISGSAACPSSGLTPSVVVLFAFSA